MEDSGVKKNKPLRHIAFVGTGPASLLKALQLAKRHPSAQITLFDTAPTPGGAWYSDLSPGGYEIECGCHIWSYVPKSYSFIEQQIGVKLYPVKPSPLFIGKRIRIPYSIKNTLDSYKILIRFLLTLRWNKLKNLKHDPHINFRIFGKRNRYPKSGSPELIDALVTKIKQQPNISLLFNARVTSCNISSSSVLLETENNRYTFDKLYLTFVSRLEQLIIHEKIHPVQVRKVDYIHFLIQMNKPLLKKITYWRLINDPIIHRITDISYQANFKEHLILVGIKDKAYHASDEEALLKHCRMFFKNYGLTDDSFQVEKIKTHIFPTHYLSDETIQELKKYEPVVSLMHTTDLMHGIYFLLGDQKIV